MRIRQLDENRFRMRVLAAVQIGLGIVLMWGANGAVAATGHPADIVAPAEIVAVPPASSGPPLWETEVVRLFGDRAGEALRVVACESAGDPNMRGDSGASIGLFQVAWGNIHGLYEYPGGIREAVGLPENLTREEAIHLLHDPLKNVHVAYETFRLRGFRWSGSGGWGCSWVTDCKYCAKLFQGNWS